MSEEIIILVDLTIVLLFAKVLEEVAARFKQPPLLGDLLAGVIVGPTVLDIITVPANVAVVGWLGIVVLIYLAGIETSLEELRRYGREAVAVALGGVAATFSLALAVASLFNYSWITSLFIAVVLAPTSVSVTVATLMELGLLRSKVGEIVIGAAVADDVYAMVLYAIVSSIATYGVLQYSTVAHIGAGLAVIFLGFYMLYRFGERIVRNLVLRSRIGGALFTHVLLIGIGFATVSAYFGLSPLVGAYFAGVALARVARSRNLHQYYSFLVSFISPFFFVYAGLLLDPWIVLSKINPWEALGAAGTIVAAGVAGKILGCGLVAKAYGLDTRSALVVGIGMMPRAGVDLVIAATGLTMGLLPMELYLGALLLIYATSLSTPVLLKLLAPRG